MSDRTPLPVYDADSENRNDFLRESGFRGLDYDEFLIGVSTDSHWLEGKLLLAVGTYSPSYTGGKDRLYLVYPYDRGFSVPSKDARGLPVSDFKVITSAKGIRDYVNNSIF